MFTGIIEEVGEVVAVNPSGDSAVLRIRATTAGEQVQHGASIAVNGVCLTVVAQQTVAQQTVAQQTVAQQTVAQQAVARQPDSGGAIDLDFDVMAETLKRSVIGALAPGQRVNLERAVRADGRLDGHIVQGHVDGTGVLLSRTPGDGWESFRFALPSELARYVAEKGSIAVNGVSLTVSGLGPDWFEVGLIPETLRATMLGELGPDDPVNLEVDVIAKYTERLLSFGRSGTENGG